MKRVIDYNLKPRIKLDGSGVDLAKAKMSMNPFDEISVEEAIRQKEKGVAVEIVIVSIGPQKAQETLRTALAMGADRAILIQNDDEVEPLAVAKLLRAVCDEEQPGLVILGKQAIDDDSNQTGQMLAALCGWPQGTFASKIDVSNEAVLVTREVDGGLETVRLALPAIVTTDLRLNQPRYASLPNISAATKAFAIDGAVVITTNIDYDTLEANLQPLLAKGWRIEAHQQGVVDELGWENLVEDVTAWHGGIDILVNNAGIDILSKAETSTFEEWRRAMAVNLDGVFIGQRTAIRMMKSRGGSIINVSSIAGKVGEPLLATDNASKGGVAQLTKAATLHCADADCPIRANLLHPGYTVTPLVAGAIASLPGGEGDAFAAGALTKIPMRRMTEPREITRPMLFLASEDASYMNGSELIDDGGYL